jgi:hypothetical protein
VLISEFSTPIQALKMQSLKLLSIALALALLDPAFGRVAQRDLHIRAVDSSDAWPASMLLHPSLST